MRDRGIPRRTRFGVAVVVVVLHIAVVAALIRAFAPDAAERAVEAVVSTFPVTVTAPPPPPSPPAIPDQPAAGAAGAAGRKAVPRAVAAPDPRIALAVQPAPAAASTGSADQSGAANTGSGTGAGGTGNGLGGALARPPEKIAGTIAERDYDKVGRALRLGSAVIIAITVSAEGRPTACRVVRASPDPAADALTCRLALERFRFRPASDAQGRPVAAIYGWQQRWFR
ncbi:MAG: hypothetical protein RLZZ427_1400 [Pseudomonadota bacterium]|jgi:protein TonB